MEPIPLHSAFLCAECEFVVHDGSKCPKCGSKALMSISRLLGGKIGNVDIKAVEQKTGIEKE